VNLFRHGSGKAILLIIKANVQLPHRIGKYDLLECLGGSTAQVYRAKDRHLGRTVAFKILSDAALADAETKARFLGEARLTGSLTHENVIAFYDYGEVEGRPFLVMEFLEGESLSTQIREGRTGDLRAKLAVARQLASALRYVHAKGIIHRDVKPDNIRVDITGRVKLVDFGIAKADDLSLTGAGFTVGTPYYMAPEQIRGAKPTRLVDVYSFGVVLFELLTGTRPFEAHSVDDIFDIILHQALDMGPIERMGVPAKLSDLIRELTDKDPTRRPQNFEEVDARIAQMIALT
jgi:eukaryotic-like serine/threonine-protein kinase